ncbi:MAG: hypothetical protein KatS3mg115_0042 [Candidatus Poribacteria bacterium]|nr:MAG: hypothetical protein KatS3mg115_0042 [Candidatus Poribacteria bacterium]
MRTAVAAVGIGWLLGLAWAAGAVEWDADRYMSVQELGEILLQNRKAQRPTYGVVQTVLQGTQVEELQVEILSIERNAFAKGHLIWAVGVDERMRKTGTAGGMSGSPVYVQGRLIGALAYGFLNAKEPFIGITPIEQMLRVWERDLTPAPVPRRPTSALAPLVSPEEWYAALHDPHALTPQSRELVSARAPVPASASPQVQRLATPVALVGFPPEARAILDAAFSRFGWATLAGAGGSSTLEEDPPVEPGSVLGIELIRGDLSAFSYGTVTLREGERILAFGHPAFGEGKSYLPVSSGYVHFVVGSYVRSFKVAGPGRVVGTLVQDREPAIAAILGENHPPYIPLDVVIRSPKGEERAYHYEVMRHPDFTASLLASAVLATFSAAEKDYGPFTMRTRLRAEFDPSSPHEPLEKENLLAGNSSPGTATALLLYPLGALLDNWFEEFPLQRVLLEVEYVDGQESAAIVAARLDRSRARPGETLELAVTYHPYLDDPIVERYRVPVPADMPEGPAMLFLGDGESYRSWERARARERYQVVSAEKLLQQLREEGDRPELYVALITPMRLGISIPGAELPNLPLSVLNVMTGATQAGEGNLTQGSEIARYVFETPFVITGSTVLGFTVDREVR